MAALDWDQLPSPQLEITDEGECVFLCHYPCRSWPGDKKVRGTFTGTPMVSCRSRAVHVM